jgi:hypothetical protein
MFAVSISAVPVWRSPLGIILARWMRINMNLVYSRHMTQNARSERASTTQSYLICLLAFLWPRKKQLVLYRSPISIICFPRTTYNNYMCLYTCISFAL